MGMEGMADSREITGDILEIGIGSGLKNAWVKKEVQQEKFRGKAAKRACKIEQRLKMAEGSEIEDVGRKLKRAMGNEERSG